MSDSGDIVQKVYVNQEGVAVMKCPFCEAVKSANVSKLRTAQQHVVKVRCTCQKVFTVKLEFRRTYRKEAKLAGDFQSLPSGKHCGRLTVVNLSKGGLGAQIIGFNHFRAGDELRISFNLDDRHHSMIDKKVVVRLVKQNYIGCEFVDSTSHDKALGFYLMV
ncbi:MAG: PilZ domain-containing protein [Desulfobulbaceae bacterium]|nr:PilZ domain-containing protein [Desulfobulbaceae bacterium]